MEFDLQQGVETNKEEEASEFMLYEKLSVSVQSDKANKILCEKIIKTASAWKLPDKSTKQASSQLGILKGKRVVYLWMVIGLETMIKHSHRKVRLLFVDFDKTCSTHDTTGLLYKATNIYRNGNLETRQTLDQKWSQVSDLYMKGYLQLLEKSAISERRTPGFDSEGLEIFLKSLSDFDKQMTKEVEKLNVFQGIDKIGIEEIANQVHLYDGCEEFLRKMKEVVHIVSLNWSTYLLSVCLKGAVSHGNIIANRILNDKSITDLSKNVADSFDKRNVVEREIQGNSLQGVSVFIGDSPSDFLAMLATDIGILIAPSKSSEAIALRYGIILKPLKEFGNNHNCVSHDTEDYCDVNGKALQEYRILYVVTSWKEINNFFL